MKKQNYNIDYYTENIDGVTYNVTVKRSETKTYITRKKVEPGKYSISNEYRRNSLEGNIMSYKLTIIRLLEAAKNNALNTNLYKQLNYATERVLFYLRKQNENLTQDEFKNKLNQTFAEAIKEFSSKYTDIKNDEIESLIDDLLNEDMKEYNHITYDIINEKRGSFLDEEIEVE